MSHLLNKPHSCDKLGGHICYKLFKEQNSFTISNTHTKPLDIKVVPCISNYSFLLPFPWHIHTCARARTHTHEKKSLKRPWDQKESMQTPHASTLPARVTCDFHSEGQCGQRGTGVIRRGCERRKKGSLAHREREDKTPAKYLCSWLVASGK